MDKKNIIELVKSKIKKFKFIKMKSNSENNNQIFFSNFFLILSYLSFLILFILPFFKKYFSKEFLEFLVP